MTRTCRRSGGLAVLVAAAAIAPAACGGSSSPHVASLGSGSSGNGSGSSDGSGSSTTAPPTGNPTQLLDEWAACMRSHGHPNLPDPTIDASKVIHITVPGLTQGSGGDAGARERSDPACTAYLTAAQTALGGGQPHKTLDQATLDKYSQCMRVNGVSNFPDITGTHLGITPGINPAPGSPAFQNANKVCEKKTGVRGLFDYGNPAPGQIIWSGANG